MQTSTRWHFGPFVADAAERRLLRDGDVVPLTPKSFALLAVLLGRPGSLFTKRELFDTVWAGAVVTDSALSRAIHEVRFALGDDAVSPHYIATAHGLGFRFVAPVSIDREAEMVRPAPTGPGLAGREADLARLDLALTDASAGRRRVVFVTGEAGIGKTALVDAFVQRQTGRLDLWAAQGRCIEQYGPAEAYLPILEALERLAPQVGERLLREVLERFAPAWLALLPWLVHDADRASLRRALADNTPNRMLREIAQALEMLARDRPILLWLEDLHWSDPSTLGVVSFVAGRRDQARLLLIATFRHAEARAGASRLHGLALRLEQRRQASELRLGPLDEAAARTYLRSRFGGAAAIPFDELGRFLHRRSEGNALFTVSIVDDLVRRGDLTQTDGTWTLKGTVAAIGEGVPDTLRHLVIEQLDRLGAEDRGMVESAAVAGADFSAAMVAAALKVEVAEVEDRCTRLAQQELFLSPRAPVPWPDGSVASGFGFVHALVWQAVHERVPASRRAEWQRRIGVAEERAYGSQSRLIATELAMRFEVARDFERCLRYAGSAGGAALARCAYEEATKLLRHALELVPKLSAEQQPRAELELLLPLGAALMASQGYAAGDVESTYRRALALCDAGGRPQDRVRVLRGLWNVAFLRADLAAALQTATELLRQAEATQDETLASDAHAKLGQTHIHIGNLAVARFHLEQAMASPAAAVDLTRQREVPRVAIYLSWVFWYTGYPDQAKAQADEALRLARAAGSPHSSAFAFGYGACLAFLRGDTAAEIALTHRLHALSVEHGILYWRLVAEFMDGRTDTDPLAASGRMRRAIDELRASGGLVGIPSLLCVLAQAQLATGQLAEARASLAEAAGLVASNGNALYAAEGMRLEGELALAEGHAADAVRCFESAVAQARQQGARSLELRAATSLARLWRAAGHPSRGLLLLAPLYAAFGDGRRTADLQQAEALLDELGNVTAGSEVLQGSILPNRDDAAVTRTSGRPIQPT